MAGLFLHQFREFIKVKWINNLPDKHFLPIDRTLHSSGEHMPEVRTVVHLHGAEVEPESDGYPDAWFTRDFEKCGPRFIQKVYKYPNNQRPTTLWYHDHAVGITRLNVYAGLAGIYIIRNEQERALNLPSGSYEMPLVIMDREFYNDGSLFYPSTIDDPPPTYPNPSITPVVLPGKPPQAFLYRKQSSSWPSASAASQQAQYCQSCPQYHPAAQQIHQQHPILRMTEHHNQ
jgi:FtsP/CotA-like multicopper oxidase with cupredoxin domain